jgi:hypothetical protein
MDNTGDIGQQSVIHTQDVLQTPTPVSQSSSVEKPIIITPQYIQIPDRNTKQNYFKPSRTVFDKHVITCMGVILSVIILLTLLALLFMLPIPLVFKTAPYTLNAKHLNGTYKSKHYKQHRHMQETLHATPIQAMGNNDFQHIDAFTQTPQDNTITHSQITSVRIPTTEIPQNPHVPPHTPPQMVAYLYPVNQHTRNPEASFNQPKELDEYQQEIQDIDASKQDNQ